jgi:hypothetical protein
MATQETILQGAFGECVKELGEKIADYEGEDFLYGVVGGTLGWWKMNGFGDIYFLGATITEVLGEGGNQNG